MDQETHANGNDAVSQIEAKLEAPERLAAALKRAPEFVSALLRLLLFQQRPIALGLYTAARSSEDFVRHARARRGDKPTFQQFMERFAKERHLGELLDLPAILEDFLSISVQESVANVYAAILILTLDKGFRELSLGNFATICKAEGGDDFAGYRLTRILRAAGNQFRHVGNWRDADNSANEDFAVLKAIGGTSYLEFEDSIVHTLEDILDIPRSRQGG